MDVQTAYSYYTTLGLANNTTIRIAVGVATSLVVAFLVFEVVAVIRKVRAGRSLMSVLIVPSAQSQPQSSLSARRKSRADKPDFFIPELAAVHSEDVLKAKSAPGTSAAAVPDGEDILSDMYAEKAAVIFMLNGLREELVASESPAAIRAIDVLIADTQRRDVNSVWQLGASRIADGTK